MRCSLLLAVPPFVSLFSGVANASDNLPVPVVTSGCNRSLQPVVTVQTLPNTAYVFHFRRLTPAPLALDIRRQAIAASTSFTDIGPGAWTLVYNIPGKGSPTRHFNVPDCGPARIPARQ